MFHFTNIKNLDTYMTISRNKDKTFPAVTSWAP